VPLFHFTPKSYFLWPSGILCEVAIPQLHRSRIVIVDCRALGGAVGIEGAADDAGVAVVENCTTRFPCKIFGKDAVGWLSWMR